MSTLLAELAEVIQRFILTLQYPGITAIMFLENVFPPIPSELVMPFAGFLVERGQMAFVAVVAAGTIGSLLGSTLLYYAGMWADERLVRVIIRRYGRWLALSEADLDRALHLFSRYGGGAVFFGRLIPLVRSLVSIPAGMARMPLRSFLFYTALGSAIWSAVLAYAGVILGENWHDILTLVRQYERLVLVMVLLAAAGYAILRVRRWRAARAERAYVLAQITVEADDHSE